MWGPLIQFVIAPLVQGLILVPLIKWLQKKLGGGQRANLVSKYMVMAFEAVESLDLPGSQKYLRAVELFTDSMRKAGLGMPTAQEIELVKHAAAQYAMAQKPKPPKVLGKK